MVANGTTDAFGYAGSITVGIEQPVGPAIILPEIELGYAGSFTRGYKETAPLLGFEFGDRSAGMAFLTARVGVEVPMSDTFKASGEVGYRQTIWSHDSFTAKLADNTAQAVSLSMPPDMSGPYAKLGLFGAFEDGMSANVSYQLSSTKAGLSHQAQVGLKLPF